MNCQILLFDLLWGFTLATYVKSYQYSAIVSPFVGSVSIGGSNGLGTLASFNIIRAITIHPIDSSIFVVDFTNRAIRKCTLSKVVTTVAGGSIGTYPVNGLGTYSQFNEVGGIAFDNQLNLFISDAGDDKIRKMDTFGYVSTLSTTGVSLNRPFGIAVNQFNNLVVCSTYNNQIVLINTFGLVKAIVGSGTGTGYTPNGVVGTYAMLNHPSFIAIHSNGDLYFTETGNDLIRKATATSYVVSIVAGAVPVAGAASGSGIGYVDGLGTFARFYNPGGIVIDNSGDIIVTDNMNGRIRMISSGVNKVRTLAGIGTGYRNGIGTMSQFSTPRCIAISSDGAIFIGDQSSIRKLIFLFPTSQPSGKS